MLTLPKLDVVSAGAGSGKTFRIKEAVGKWVREGLVQPDRIVAVTFTEAAATELKERVRKELLDLDRPEDALKLDQAYISTIHSFGLRILTEFAFEGGLPPRSRLLEKNEETALLRQAIARAGDLDVLTRDLPRFGYTYDGGTKTSGEEQFRQMVQTIIGRLRTVGQEMEAQKLTGFARDGLAKTYGTTGDGNIALGALHRAVNALLDSFPNDISGAFADKPSVVKEYRKNHADLSRARNKERLATDWPLWQALRKLRQSKRGAPTPGNYDALADDVIMAADQLPGHPGPLADAIRHADVLIGSAVEAIEGYAEEKKRAALVDYPDMLAAAHFILASGSDALEALSERVDCLVIDEFQDTNPLQFSLLWLLYQKGIPALIVGDLKQAIMGFQGADPRLMQKLLDHEQASNTSLENNWRTQPALMPFINRVGRALFPEEYIELSPRAEAGFQTPLEVFDQPKPPSGGAKKATRALSVAARIKALLDDPNQLVRDQRSGKKRNLNAQDIAILCPTNGQLQDYADALRKFGVSAKITEGGWYSSRIVQLALHALTFAESPSDRHAGLYLSCTEFGVHDLKSALSELIENQEITDPILETLRPLHGEIPGAIVAGVLSRTIRALDLHGRIATWPDAEKHRADLLRLEAEAQAFVDAKPETLASGGFFGSGAKTFIAWLEDKVEQDREADQRPDPDASATNAVEIVTWHRSKGREWPVIFVCGWDTEVKPRLPDVSVEYEHFENLDFVLDDARISFTPKFAAPEANDRFFTAMMDAATLSAKRLIYVALTRAKERLVLEWHSHLEGSTKTTYHSVFMNQTGANLTDTGIEVEGKQFPCLVTRNSGIPPDPPSGAVIAESLPTYGLRAIKPAPLLNPKEELFTAPSSLTSDKKSEYPPFEVVSYGKPLVLDLGVSGAEYGSIIHRCFEVLTASPDATSFLSDATGHSITDEQGRLIAESHAALIGWLRETLGASVASTETPFTTAMSDGSNCTGLIDLLVQTPNGIWVIDHKTDQASDHQVLFSHYWPQLHAYGETIRGTEHTFAGTALNLVGFGKLLLCQASEQASSLSCRL